MKLVTAHTMRMLDEATIRSHGIPSLVLMERAGKAVADYVLGNFRREGSIVAIVVGRGNNGGDGLVCARHLASAGSSVIVIMLAQPSDLSPDARANFELLAPMGATMFMATNEAELMGLTPQVARASCIVDAIFGTGLARNAEGLERAAIDLINMMKAKVVSIDMPSGLSSDTGLPLQNAVKASATVTLGLPKVGLVIGRGPDFAGRIEVADIGIPPSEVDKVESDMRFIEPSEFRHLLRPRDPNSHKGTYGHVVIFAGARGHIGAGYLSALAALRTGAGLVTYCLPERAFAKFDARYPEVMCDAIPDDGTAAFAPAGMDAALKSTVGKSAVVIGPAIGTEPQTRIFTNDFVRRSDAPLIIDADGLNNLDIASLSTRKKLTILTPHPGEMAKLVGKTISEIQSDRLKYATQLARSARVIVVLKGRGTIVAMPDGKSAINTTGNAGMATAGMGDALTGIMAAFIAEGMQASDAAIAAVFIHGLAGDMAASELGERSLITSDVIRKIPHAIKSVESEPLSLRGAK